MENNKNEFKPYIPADRVVPEFTADYSAKPGQRASASDGGVNGGSHHYGAVCAGR